MILCSDCIKGSLDEGIPRGKDSTIAGVPCYITQPPAEAANGCAVILATDAFGYQLINARLIADAYADAGYTCVVPDYFQGEPMNIQLLETYEAVSSQSIFGKIAKGLQLLFLVAKQPLWSWFSRHPLSYAVDVVTAVAAALRGEHGAKKVGLQGYCYGGSTGVLLASKPRVLDAVVVAHPGFLGPMQWPVLLRLPDAVQDICIPAMFICADHDGHFPEHTRTHAQQVLDDKSPGLATFILYPGTRHGFAVRGNKHDPAVNAARADALQNAITFLQQHLAGVTPPPQRLDESQQPPVGKRIVLAPRRC